VAKPLTLAGSNDELLAAWSLRPGVELDHSFAFDDAADAGHGFWPSDDLAAFEFAANQPRGGAGARVPDIYAPALGPAEAVQAAPSDAVLSTLGPAYNALSGDTLVFKPLAAPDPSHPAAPQASIAPEFVLNPAGELVHAASVLDGLAVALPPSDGTAHSKAGDLAAELSHILTEASIDTALANGAARLVAAAAETASVPAQPGTYFSAEQLLQFGLLH
jgi:hypothetical protein